MTQIKQLTAVLFLMLTFFACGNKSTSTESSLNDEVTEDVMAQPDTTSHTAQEEKIRNADKPTAPVSSASSSSSHSNKSGGYDNMRGFDPASEDDMEDNGMSRYMENNDEEGWD